MTRELSGFPPTTPSASFNEAHKMPYPVWDQRRKDVRARGRPWWCHRVPRQSKEAPWVYEALSWGCSRSL